MSTEKIDMSLDDIIKLSNTGRGRGRGGSLRPGRRGIRGFRGRGRGFGRSTARFNVNRRGFGGVLRGGVQRRRGYRQTSFAKNVQRAGGVWQHDMFTANAGFQQRGNFGSSDGANKFGKLLISNLDFGVNDADIKELFAEFGILRKAAVHYDRSGRSLGTAEVMYATRNAAINALKQYNNVPLDGRPMKIQLLGGTASTAVTFQSRGGARGGTRGASSARGFRGGGRGRARGFGRGGRGRGRGGTQKMPTRDELDAQLDAYNAKMDTN